MLIRFNFGSAGPRCLRGFVGETMRPLLSNPSDIDGYSYYDVFDCAKNREVIEKFYSNFEIVEETSNENIEEKLNLSEEGITPNPEVKKKRRKES